MDYQSVTETAEKWGVSTRRVRLLAEQGRILGAFKDGRNWKIPADASQPNDGRVKNKVIPEKYKSLFFSIDHKLKELNKLRPLTQTETERLMEEFLIDFTYNSNAIEGNTLTLQETALILSQGVTVDGKPLKDYLEAIGHRDAFLYVLSLVQDKVKLSEKVIKEIHSLVLMDRKEDRGQYRRLPVRIMGASTVPPQPYIVPKMMEELLVEYKDMLKTLHIVHMTALFHLKFEGIHPFIDGNGRTGRLLVNLELMQAGLLPINVKFSDRKKYYDCFHSYAETGQEDAMVNLIAAYVDTELAKYLEMLK